MSKLLSKFQAAAAAPIPTKRVKIKWDEDVIEVEVRALNGAAAKKYREQLKKKPDELDGLLVVHSVFDPETGEPVFGVEHVEMIESAPYLFSLVKSAINDLNWPDAGNAG